MALSSGEECLMSFRKFPLSPALLAPALLLTAQFVPSSVWGAAAEPPAGDADARLALRTAEAVFGGVRTVELPNGLRVYLKPIPGAATVTTMVVYKVGSADEDKDHTGLAHYLEHLLFKGTVKLKPGDIDRLTYRLGAMNNAYTTTDMTAYHFNLPAGRWLPALEVEADRMRNVRIDREHEFDKEKTVVINELTRNEDTPWDLENKLILPLLFGKGPYGHPIIGERAHVLGAAEKVIKSFYDRWYHPNNAALVMVGGFDADEALAAIRRLFGPIPRAKLPPRKALPAQALERPARGTMTSKFAVPRLQVAFNTVDANHPDRPALDVLAALLGSGKTSRLYKRLVEGAEVAGSVSADHTAGRYPGYLSVSVEVMPGKDRADVEKRVLKEIALVRDEKATPAELKRVKHGILAGMVYGSESTMGLANTLANAVTVSDLERSKKYLPAVMAVTAADVQRVAKKYLSEAQRVVVWSVPPKGKEVGRIFNSSRPERGRFAKSSHASRAADKVGGGFDLKRTKRVVLPNGLVLLLFENRRLPLVEAHALVRDLAFYEPADKSGVLALTGAMLEEGTRKRSGQQVAEAIEDVGGVLSMGGSSNSVRVLSTDRKLGLELLLECLTQPSFPKDAFARNQARVLADIADNETRPDARARQAYRAAVYGRHPLGRPPLGTSKSVASLTAADCAAFHKKAFVPNNTILAVVGDFDSKEVVEEVKRLTEGWKKAPLKVPELPPVTKPKRFEQIILTMPEAAQLAFYMGHVGIRRNNPDYYKLLVLDYVLGTGPGFTDRLSSRLRDREGLAYTVSATITPTAGKEPGTFTCYIGTAPENFAKVKKVFLEELNRIRTEVPTAREVADAKNYLIGSQMLRYGTNGGIAGQLLNVERYGLGLNYPEDFRRAVERVTPEDVRDVARKYIDPERMVLVAAGAIDQQGRPLGGGKE
jgi:zinc protease